MHALFRRTIEMSDSRGDESAIKTNSSATITLDASTDRAASIQIRAAEKQKEDLIVFLAINGLPLLGFSLPIRCL